MIAFLLSCAPKNVETEMPADSLASRPEVPELGTYSPPSPRVLTLSTGTDVWLVERTELPLVSIRLIIEGGSSSDPAPHPGLAWLTDSLLTHGAGDRDAVEFAAFAEQQAIDLSVSTAGTTSVVYLSTHTDRLEDALDLLADAVLRPALTAADLERVRAQQIGEITQALDEPWTIAPWVAARLYFGADHPLAHPGMGTAQGLSGVTEADLQASWSQRYVTSRAHFVVVGAVDEVALTAALEARFGDWSAGSHPPALPDPVGVTTGPRLVFVDNPDSAQTALRVIMPGWNADSDGVAAGELATVAIGGTFTSRLNRLMREEKGYTYGARAQLQSAQSYGLVVAASSVQADSSAEGLTDMLSVLQGARDGFTEEERSKAFGSVRTELIESMGSRDATAGSLAALHSQGLAADNLAVQLREASAVDIAMMQDAWLPRSDLSGALVLVVGDLAEIRASVEEAVPGDWTVVDKMPAAGEQ